MIFATCLQTTYYLNYTYTCLREPPHEVERTEYYPYNVLTTHNFISCLNSTGAINQYLFYDDINRTLLNTTLTCKVSDNLVYFIAP